MVILITINIMLTILNLISIIILQGVILRNNMQEKVINRKEETVKEIDKPEPKIEDKNIVIEKSPFGEYKYKRVGVM